MPAFNPNPPKCKIENCEQRAISLGMCSRHYASSRRRGSIENLDTDLRSVIAPVLSTKICGKCGLDLPIERFQMNATERNPLRRKSICAECVASNIVAKKESRRKGGKCSQCDAPALPDRGLCQVHYESRQNWRSLPTSRVREILGAARDRSEKSGVICSIDEEWVRSRLIAGKCEMTGLPFDFQPGRKIGRFNPYAPSIDRKAAGGHYSPDNCRMVIMAINVGMNFWGEEIYRHVAKAYLKQRRAKKTVSAQPETYNLLLENTHPVRVRKH
jgi:ribosomal protein S27AE